MVGIIGKQAFKIKLGRSLDRESASAAVEVEFG
jgi:hypothetical protein